MDGLEDRLTRKFSRALHACLSADAELSTEVVVVSCHDVLLHVLI